MRRDSIGMGWGFVVVLCALLLAACSKADRSEPAPAASAMPASAAAPGAGANAQETPSASLGREAAQITTVTLSFTVTSVDEAARKVRDEVARADGYVANMNGGGLDARDRRASFELRIPAARVGAFRAALAGIGDLTQEEERVEDVGEERADRRARLANARAEEKRLLDLLAQRTGSLADVLTAERELARVRETIERYDAPAAALDGKIAYATVHVSLSPRVVTFVPHPLQRLGEAAHEGVHNASVLLLGMGVLAAEAGPTLLILCALLAAVVLAVRKALRVHARRSAASLTQF